MPWRNRESLRIIPGFVKLNLSQSVGRKTTRRPKRFKGSHSWTLSIPKLVSYNTRDGKFRVNTPGPGWWESYSRSQRQARKLEKRVAKAPAQAKRGSVRKGDPQAAMYARYFADLRREGVDPAEAARAAGRCETCGHRMRPGQWCVPCAEKAAKRHEQTEARAAARGRQESRLYGKPTHEWQRPPGYEPGDEYTEAVTSGRMSMVAAERRRHLGVEEAERIEAEERAARKAKKQAAPLGSAEWLADLNEQNKAAFSEHQAALRRTGACGARTKDGTGCLNRAGTCPHHSGVRL